MATKRTSKLTPKQQRFVEEYLLDLNATAAARRAGYSEKTAEQQGPRLLGNVGVAAAICDRKAKRSQRTEITADWVLEQYAAVWNAKITDILEERERFCHDLTTGKVLENPETKEPLIASVDWELKPLDEWPEIWLKMTTPAELKRLKQRSRDGKDASWDDIGQQIKFNMFPKRDALQKIGEHVMVKAFPQRGDLNLTLNIDGIREELAAARERAQAPERVM